MANDVIKALQDARKALEMEYNEKIKQIDATIALFSGSNTGVSIASIGAAKSKSEGEVSKRGRKPGSTNAKAEKKSKSTADKKIRFSTSQITDEILDILSSNKEAINLKELSANIISRNNWENVDAARVGRSIYLALRPLIEQNKVKTMKKEGNKKVDYFHL